MVFVTWYIFIISGCNPREGTLAFEPIGTFSEVDDELDIESMPLSSNNIACTHLLVYTYSRVDHLHI